MDLAAQMALVNAHENAEEKKLGLETVFVAPNPSVLPDDGVLTYLVVASVYDLKAVAPGTVVLVDVDFSPTLKLVAEHPLTFGLKVIVLTGLPTAEYSSAFDSATWNCDKVSYAGLIADINESRLTSQADSTANASLSEKEKASFTRADGSIKGHQAMVFKTDDVVEESSDEES